MYQIFVVEDELLIRQSIRNTIEKMQGPYSFCGEASDGEMALSMMQDLMPDILLTDIRMPFLDGFGLIEHAKTIMPWLKVAIITGFGDIESAQKAIRLGVDQYLLKPVRPADIVKVVEEMAQEIDADKAKTSAAGFDTDEVKIAMKKHFVGQLLYGGTDTGELLNQARKLKLDIVRPFYQVAIFNFDTPDLDHKIVKGVVEKTTGGVDQVLCFFSGVDQMVSVLCGNDESELNEKTYQFINIVKHELNDQCPVITAVVGNIVRRLGEISASHKELAFLLKKVSTVSAGKTISAEDTSSITADIVQFSGPFGPDLYQKIRCAVSEDPEDIFTAITTGIDTEQFGSTLVRYNALVQLLKVAVHIMASNAPTEDEKDIVDRVIAEHNVFSASGTHEDFCNTAKELIKLSINIPADRTEEYKYNNVINKAVSYVAENFCDPNISLISVAKNVGMSAAHFSTVFSQKQGRTFINYLTSLRIDYAKELLAKTNMKLADIALKIGYNEPNYFSHVFRKAEGITPKEYRNQITNQ